MTFFLCNITCSGILSSAVVLHIRHLLSVPQYSLCIFIQNWGISPTRHTMPHHIVQNAGKHDGSILREKGVQKNEKEKTVTGSRPFYPLYGSSAAYRICRRRRRRVYTCYVCHLLGADPSHRSHRTVTDHERSLQFSFRRDLSGWIILFRFFLRENPHPHL